MKKTRIEIEKETITQMIVIYCKGHHKEEWKKKKRELQMNENSYRKNCCLCEQCFELHEYSMERLANCKFANEKKFCSQCTIKCYHPKYKDKIKEVMKYSGPRILSHHPVLVIKHMFVK